MFTTLPTGFGGPLSSWAQFHAKYRLRNRVRPRAGTWTPAQEALFSTSPTSGWTIDQAAGSTGRRGLNGSAFFLDA
ncbi:MAG: hypothetical protein ABI277_06540 [Burkholderiaceae bacterium]